MSALGQKQTWRRILRTSALPPKADFAEGDWHVRFVPKADIKSLIAVIAGCSDIHLAIGRGTSNSIVDDDYFAIPQSSERNVMFSEICDGFTGRVRVGMI